LNTDEAQHYKAIGKNFAAHDAVNHSEEENVRHEEGKLVTTNTVEGFFGIFKRGMVGVYQNYGEHSDFRAITFEPGESVTQHEVVYR
jgi:hypothetical protein